MALIGYIGQLQGPFSAGEELLQRIKPGATSLAGVKCKLGIQTSIMVPGTSQESIVIINGTEIMMGRSGVYETDDLITVKSLKFKFDAPAGTIIDFAY